MVDVNKSTLTKNIWKTFKDRIVSEVVNTSETLSDSTIVTLSKVAASYPDKAFETKSNYPMCIVTTPTMSTEKFTLARSKVDGMIDVEIYTNQSESADGYVDKIIDAIETGKLAFASNGLHMVHLDSTESDMVQRGSIKIHVRIARFTFQFRYTDTGAF